MYYLRSKNKGADQLHSYRDLHLRLGICKKQVFSHDAAHMNFVLKHFFFYYFYATKGHKLWICLV